MDVFGQVLCGPARHSPVAEGDVEVQNLPRIIQIKVVAAKRDSFDGRVPLFGSVLLRDGNIDEVSRLDERGVPELDKDVVRLDVCALVSQSFRGKTWRNVKESVPVWMTLWS